MAKVKFTLPTEEPTKTSTREIKNKDKARVKVLAIICIVELLIIGFFLYK